MMMKWIVIAVAAATLAGCSSSEPDEEENRLISDSLEQLAYAHADTCRCVSVNERAALSRLNTFWKSGSRSTGLLGGFQSALRP